MRKLREFLSSRDKEIVDMREEGKSCVVCNGYDRGVGDDLTFWGLLVSTHPSVPEGEMIMVDNDEQKRVLFRCLDAGMSFDFLKKAWS